MNSSFTRLYGLFVLMSICYSGLAAQTSISGTINQYSEVLAVDYSVNAVTVFQPGLFNVGDQVLLIQMQGAIIDESDSGAFGNVSAYSGAGNYELATVCDKTGNDITFENELANLDYDENGSLQLVTVPEYGDAVVAAELTGQAWDGTIGGVVALSVMNNLTLDAPIVMDGKGFRGGVFENNQSNCNFLIQVNNYFYPGPLDGGGKKGESFASYAKTKEYGRGAQAGGGGGGNDHNSGGGGGANAGAGGIGGDNISTAFLNCDGDFPGEGGKLPALTANRIFLGSGGGAGDGNNSIGTDGGDGGGIVIIFAGTLTVGASASISADGIAAGDAPGGDGAGGGGAGGSIYLEAGAVSGTPLFSVTGGKGGDVDNEGNDRCFGPGGGGGGGLIRTNVAIAGGSLVVNGGIAGGSTNSAAGSCSGSNGAQAGGNGLVLSDGIPEGSTPTTACVSVPVNWEDISLQQAAKRNLIFWSVANQVNNDYFTLERSADGETFRDVASVSATSANDYQLTDAAPLAGNSFYRVKQTDFDGEYSYSPTVSSHRAYTEIRLYPSLAQVGQPVKFDLPEALLEGEVTICLVDQNGRRVWQKTQPMAADAQFETTGLSAGVYLINLRNDRLNWTGRLVIGR